MMTKKDAVSDRTLRIAPATYSASTVGFVEQMLSEAVRYRASDIHIERYESAARLRYRLDGLLRAVRTDGFLFREYPAVTTRIKVLAGMDIAVRRVPQDGGFNFSCPHGSADVRVSVLPAITGERFVLRLLETVHESLDFPALGMSRLQTQAVQRTLSASQGMILVTGPTGSGKTTTLYTMLSELNREGINILTVENPIERKIEGIGQVQVCEESGLDFSHALRAFLRQDPEVILIGEIRDSETADIAAKAALTGHLVLSTLHTNDAATTILRLNGLGLPTALINTALSLVVSQRLVRLVCPRCKTPDTTPMVLPGVNRDHAELFIGKGCRHCAWTGCKNRRGIFEMLEFNARVRHAVESGEPAAKLMRFAVGDGNLTTTARAMLASGALSMDEYLRVVHRPDLSYPNQSLVSLKA